MSPNVWSQWTHNVMITRSLRKNGVVTYFVSAQTGLSLPLQSLLYERYRVVYERAIHYNDVIMITMASQITSLTVVYSNVYSDADQRKHQSSASLAFVWGIHRDRWIPRTKGQLRGKCFHLMTSSWSRVCSIPVPYPYVTWIQSMWRSDTRRSHV